MADSVDRELYSRKDYNNWTVDDLIEMLSRHPGDAPVFIIDPADDECETLHPVEFLAGNADGVML